MPFLLYNDIYLINDQINANLMIKKILCSEAAKKQIRTRIDYLSLIVTKYCDNI